MKCKNCDADLSEGTIKCPFCKDILSTVDNPMFENFNFKYTITSEEQIKMIRNAANEGKSSFNSILKRNSGKKKRKKVFLRDFAKGFPKQESPFQNAWMKCSRRLLK